MKHRDLWEIYRRWRAGQSQARIAAGTRRERQQSFTGSFCSMWHFYGGSTELVSPDNLKAGVLKPDLWDPQINRALGEAAEHYGVFIDPCRVGRSTDKGKVERFVPVARELFRRLAALHVDAPLRELNEHARRARAMLAVMDEHAGRRYFDEVCRRADSGKSDRDFWSAQMVTAVR
ncbi:MAG: hypothetical protein OXJ90_23455 [Spirochaetaceae bacterium]|nr:hypothetical protein [Spirochaetaceae bacterium]